MQAPTVSVVTVTFNSKEYIRGCLGSVAENDSGVISIEHIVVDNGSRDGSAALVRSEFPRAIVIENPVNRGFTAANNQGQALARGRYVVFLNPDTVVPRGTFQTMADTMDRHAELGVLAPRLVDEHGRWSLDMGHRSPTAWTVINSFMLVNRLSHDVFRACSGPRMCGDSRTATGRAGPASWCGRRSRRPSPGESSAPGTIWTTACRSKRPAGGWR